MKKQKKLIIIFFLICIQSNSCDRWVNILQNYPMVSYQIKEFNNQNDSLSFNLLIDFPPKYFYKKAGYFEIFPSLYDTINSNYIVLDTIYISGESEKNDYLKISYKNGSHFVKHYKFKNYIDCDKTITINSNYCNSIIKSVSLAKREIKFNQ